MPSPDGRSRGRPAAPIAGQGTQVPAWDLGGWIGIGGAKAGSGLVIARIWLCLSISILLIILMRKDN